MTRRLLISAVTAFIFAIAVLIHPPGRAYACSCMVPPPAGEARDQADAVFSGTADKIIRYTESSNLEVEFLVAESWKGPLAPAMRVRTATNSAACGYEFVEGERYLIYANEQDGALAVNLCSRTAPLDAASADLQALGAGRPAPQAMHDVITPQDTLARWLPAVIGGVAVAGAVAFVIISRRRRVA